MPKRVNKKKLLKSRKSFGRSLLLPILVVAVVAIGGYVVHKSHAATGIYYSPGGTYSDWYFPSNDGYSSLEWTFVPVQNPSAGLAQAGLLHYYAYNFSLLNSTNNVGNGYAGFQTNGLFNGTAEGEVINFSIWGSNSALSSGLINPHASECGCYQIMYKYAWTIGHNYRFTLKEGHYPVGRAGKWWGLWVTDQNTNKLTFIGEQRVPATINGLSSRLLSGHTSMFGEDTHWQQTLNGDVKYTDCKHFHYSAMAALSITVNGNLRPASSTSHTNSGQVNTGSNGFKTTNCPVTTYTDGLLDVQHNLGSWPFPAPNSLPMLQKG